MRIALMIHALYGGGAERLMADLAQRWCGQHELHLVTWSRIDTDTYPVPPTVQRHGLDLLRESPSPIHALFANIQRVSRLRHCLREIAPDLILSFSDRTNIVAIQAARPLGCPIWISEHSDPAQQRLGYVWEHWRKRTYPACTGCTVLTPGIADTMSQWIEPSKLHVIPPAIHAPSPKPSASHGKTELKRILFLGRLSSEKRVQLLLEAWSSVAHQLENWQLDIVGDGPLRGELEQQANSMRRVEFHGWVDDPSDYLAQADVFALTSAYEGFPVSLLEAMSYQTACISTDCTTAIDLLNAQEPCVVKVPDASAETIAEQLEKLCTDEELRSTLAAVGKRRARDFYWNEIGPLWDQLLDGAN